MGLSSLRFAQPPIALPMPLPPTIPRPWPLRDDGCTVGNPVPVPVLPELPELPELPDPTYSRRGGGGVVLVACERCVCAVGGLVCVHRPAGWDGGMSELGVCRYGIPAPSSRCEQASLSGVPDRGSAASRLSVPRVD